MASYLLPSPGNLGTPILRSLLHVSGDDKDSKFTQFIACVHSQSSKQRLSDLFSQHVETGKLRISKGDNVKAVQDSDIVILGVDPADVEVTLKQQGLARALQGKLLISVAAG